MEKKEKKNLNNKKIKIIILPIFVILILLIFYLLGKTFIFFSKPLYVSNKSANELYKKFDNIKFKSSKFISNKVKIREGGSYDLTGDYDCLWIDTNSNVIINFKDTNITCSDGPAIYIKSANIVKLNFDGKNELTANTTEDLPGAIYSKEDLILSGNGYLNINSNHDGIVSKDSLIIKNGTYNIISKDDAIRSSDSIAIVDGKFTIDSLGNGFKTSNDWEKGKGFIVIDNGTFNITSYKNAFQAKSNLFINNGKYKIINLGDANSTSSKAFKANQLLQILNGNFEINSLDDAIHSDNNILITNGNFSIRTDSDAYQATNIIQMDGGTHTIKARRGIVTTKARINSGSFKMRTAINGIKATNRSGRNDSVIVFNGGVTNISMEQGTTIAVYTDRNIFINDGSLNIKAKYPFQYGGEAKYKKGNLVINNKEKNSITNQLNESNSKKNSNKDNNE